MISYNSFDSKDKALEFANEIRADHNIISITELVHPYSAEMKMMYAGDTRLPDSYHEVTVWYHILDH